MKELKFLYLCCMLTLATTTAHAQQAVYDYPVKTLKTKLTADNLYEPYFVKHIYPKQKFIRKNEIDYSDRGLGIGLFYSYTKSSKGSISFSPKESPICGNGHLELLKGRLRTYSSAPDGSGWLRNIHVFFDRRKTEVVKKLIF